MDLHGSAALSRRQRRRLVRLVGAGMTIRAAAVIVGCSRQTGSKWVNRSAHGCVVVQAREDDAPDSQRLVDQDVVVVRMIGVAVLADVEQHVLEVQRHGGEHATFVQMGTVAQDHH